MERFRCVGLEVRWTRRSTQTQKNPDGARGRISSSTWIKTCHFFYFMLHSFNSWSVNDQGDWCKSKRWMSLLIAFKISHLDVSQYKQEQNQPVSTRNNQNQPESNRTNQNQPESTRTNQNRCKWPAQKWISSFYFFFSLLQQATSLSTNINTNNNTNTQSNHWTPPDRDFSFWLTASWDS